MRLKDGTAVGVELQMTENGLQAAFKSESNDLLRSLESQWKAFVDRNVSDLKVASSVFEGRSGLDLSNPNSGSDARERREAFEDSAAAASLAGQEGEKDVSRGLVELPDAGELPPLRLIGRLNIYA
jgi:hypothetical protein